MAEPDTIDALLKAIKRPFSYRIKQLLIQSGSQLLERLTIRQRPGVTTFRYYLLDPPQQYPDLPTVHGLPAEWLNAPD